MVDRESQIFRNMIVRLGVAEERLFRYVEVVVNVPPMGVLGVVGLVLVFRPGLVLLRVSRPPDKGRKEVGEEVEERDEYQRVFESTAR